MTFEWPRSDDPVTLDADRSWTAIFDSYDQRNDDIYYVVTITGRDGSRTRVVATTWPSWVGDDWTVPEFLPGLRRALHDVAARGESNTAYRPSWLPP